jgi:hypothetical protein
MPRHRLNFDNVNDGIDWEHALPPHVVAQREAARPAPPPMQHSRTLVFDWPLPENHPALQQQPARRALSRALNVEHAQAQPQSLGDNPIVASRRDMIARRERDLVDIWTGTTRAPVVQSRRTQGVPQPAIQRRETTSPPPTVATSLPHRALPQLPERRASSRSPPPPPVAQSHGRETQQNRGDERGELQDVTNEALMELGSLAVPTGLSKEQLAKMKAQPFASNEPVDCAICLDDVKPGDQSMKLLCKHVFHPQCIVQWLARTNRCPTCRCEIRRKE